MCYCRYFGNMKLLVNLHLMDKMPHFDPTPSPVVPQKQALQTALSVTHTRIRAALCVSTIVVAAAFLALAAPCRALSDSPSLPDAPLPHPAVTSSSAASSNADTVGPGRDHVVFGVHVGPGYPAQASKSDTIINPGERAPRLTAKEKVLYAVHEQLQPVVLVPALLSAGYGQLADANPRYGIDAGGFGERFGGAMLRQATDRISGDGLLAAAFHQDPRYYRDANGPILHRGLDAVTQTFVRRNDDGEKTINASGILGHAVSNFLAMTYYPHVSAKASIAAQGFGTSVAADMGSKLIVEFGPDLLRKAFVRNP